MHHRVISHILSKIQDYCLEEKLPPLTILVVGKSNRHPVTGFIAWDIAADDAPGSLEGERFDLILMLAVLEHLSEPWRALARAGRLLAPEGLLAATTPHPAGRVPLEAGAALGLLSRSADEEHETLLGRAELVREGEKAGLALVSYRRFLLGLNQLALFRAAVP